MPAIYNPAKLESAFRKVVSKCTAPHQSSGSQVRFPGSSLAAAEMGISRSHLHRVLAGERKSETLLARWNAWLQRHPQFASLQPR